MLPLLHHDRVLPETEQEARQQTLIFLIVSAILLLPKITTQ